MDIQEKVREMRLRWYGHTRESQRNETTLVWTHAENGRKQRSESRKKAKREIKREMGGWRPKGHADTADHPGGCPGQNILEIKNSGC